MVLSFLEKNAFTVSNLMGEGVPEAEYVEFLEGLRQVTSDDVVTALNNKVEATDGGVYMNEWSVLRAFAREIGILAKM